jgi:hypothetical protein
MKPPPFAGNVVLVPGSLATAPRVAMARSVRVLWLEAQRLRSVTVVPLTVLMLPPEIESHQHLIEQRSVLARSRIVEGLQKTVRRSLR